jgi:transposase
MRGRLPQAIAIAPEDDQPLRQLARSHVAPWFQVRRARIVLAIAGGGRVRVIADANQCDPATVRCTCGLYRRLGLAGLLAPPQRPGRPPRISPLQRAQIVELACLKPIVRGLHITHWSSTELARQAVGAGIVGTIDHST